MKPDLKEYSDFANQLNLTGKKTLNGSFKYVDKDTGDTISPYLLGKLYRLVKIESIKILEQTVNSFEYDIIKQQIKLKELPKAIKDEIQSQRFLIESFKKELE